MFTHLGDLGRVDSDGFFYVCGRIKELIVTAGGKETFTIICSAKKSDFLPPGENISPVPIEDAIKEELQVFKEKGKCRISHQGFEQCGGCLLYTSPSPRD